MARFVLKAAALQASSERPDEFAAIVRRAVEFARGTNRPSILCRAACTGLLRPANDKALTEACLTLARRAMELGKADEKVLPRCQMVWEWPCSAPGVMTKLTRRWQRRPRPGTVTRYWRQPATFTGR